LVFAVLGDKNFATFQKYFAKLYFVHTMYTARQHALAAALCAPQTLDKFIRFLKPYPLIAPYANTPSRLPPRQHGDSREVFDAQAPQVVHFLRERRIITNSLIKNMALAQDWIHIFNYQGPHLHAVDMKQKNILLHNLCVAFTEYIFHCVWVIADTKNVWHATQALLRSGDDAKYRYDLDFALRECEEFSAAHSEQFMFIPPISTRYNQPQCNVRRCDIDYVCAYVDGLMCDNNVISLGGLVDLFSKSFLQTDDVHTSANTALFVLISVIQKKHPVLFIL
jgi:hypothetical protein